MIEVIIKDDNFRVGSDRFGLQDVCDLFKIVIITFPDEDERNTSESIDQREEETMNEVVVVYRAKIVNRSHKLDKDLTELVLTSSTNTCCLEEVYQEPHCLFRVLNKDASRTSKGLNHVYWCLVLDDFLSAFIIED